MTQKVLKVGSSAGVTISKSALKELGWKIGSRVTIHVDPDKQVVKIQPVKGKKAKQDEVAKLTKRFIDRYRSDLLALAQKE